MRSDKVRVECQGGHVMSAKGNRKDSIRAET